jgi:hypothetical protein
MLHKWQMDVKRRSSIRALQRNAAVVGLDRPSRDGEAKPCPAAVARPRLVDSVKAIPA